jgi:hypothetical protein
MLAITSLLGYSPRGKYALKCSSPLIMRGEAANHTNSPYIEVCACSGLRYIRGIDVTT